MRNWKKEMGFGSTEAVWMWSREAKQQTHPEFKWIFKKGKGKTSEYLHHRGVFVIGSCCAFVSFISHSLTVTSFHPSQQNTAGFSTMINCLNSTSDRDCDVAQIPLGVCLYIRYWTVKKWCSSPQEENCLESLMRWRSEWEKKIMMQTVQKQHLSRTNYTGEYTTCLFTGTQWSAVSYDSLFSCHLENIQWSVDAIVPSMLSTDLIGTQDRQPNREINSLSVCDWGQQPLPLLSVLSLLMSAASKCSGFHSQGQFTLFAKRHNTQ